MSDESRGWEYGPLLFHAEAQDRDEEAHVTYDAKCLVLAEAFLSDHREALNALGVWSEYSDALAQDIQRAIEDFLNEKGLP